ncbi:glutaredoxin family protein [Gulosibacter massiliensis]|uniref:glutaredoxin family protein n=1 Tax=Gulosibacter massiliensis TaxID=2479839 RepID=UPI000F62D944|nr:glutaredoxin family protein [Gulosibacter massiliensis]
MIVDFYEKPGCHLCEDAAPIVVAEAAAAGAELRRHNILADAQLQARYGELIPVVVIDGEQHSTWFVDQARLRDALG